MIIHSARFPVMAWLMCLAIASTAALGQNQATFRFYQGVTAYIDNAQGKPFEIAVDVRDWNLMENGPREMLLKVYDPDGRVLERKVVEDDGVVGHAYLPEAGGWDHEMWYHLLNYGRGSVPMIAWSSLTSPTRVAALKARTYTVKVDHAQKGVYRVLMMGSRDHVATLHVSNDLNFGLAGHPMWMHGHGDMFKKAYVYVPKGTTGIDLGFAEYDQPVTRRFTIIAPDKTVLYDGPATGGFQSRTIKFDKPGQYDDQIITVEVSQGSGDYMIHMLLGRDDVRQYRGWSGAPAIFATDEKTARALQGGAIYHDGQVFWHGFQVRFHDWLKNNLKDDDYIVKDANGNVIEPSEGPKFGWNTPSVVYKGLPKGDKPFIPLNGGHEAPPVCDTLMHDYVAHKNRQVLNVALRDLQEGLRMLTVGDMPVINRWMGNMGYVFATYGWHYWRPAWRILQQSDAPDEVKSIIKEAFILAGDRLAFARGIERTNGNAMSHIPMALRYCYEATRDPLQKQLADVYLERFANGGWGRGAGISKSGDCQEHFAHDFHYGTYIYANYRAVTNDLNDERFRKIINRISELYGYLYCPEASAYPWNSRTAQPAGLGSGNYKGVPGDDFTVSVNGGDEWFAARRPNYYILTFHGRLAPEWLNHYFGTKMGYGGGILCQVTVPGQGTVIASTPSGKYGHGMQRYNWRNFHIHSMVGTMASGEPFVAADSEHNNAKLVGNTVNGDGEVRYQPVHVRRAYTFQDSFITVDAQLSDTVYRAGYQGRGEPSILTELYEMIPYVAGKGAHATKVTAYDDAGNLIGPVTDKPMQASAVVIDRNGYGVQVVLPSPYTVKLGVDDTVMIQLIDGRTKAADVNLTYTLVPYVGEPVIGQGAIVKEALTMLKLPGIDSPEHVANKLAAVEPRVVQRREGELASIRFAVAGDDLAIDALVTDEKPSHADVPWKGSSFEIFCSPPDGEAIAQVFLLPAVGDKPAAGLKAASPSPVPMPQIRVVTQPTKTGYHLQALVPLSVLNIEPTAAQTTLEFQIGAVLQGKLSYATMFNSIHAYQNDARYGLFNISEK